MVFAIVLGSVAILLFMITEYVSYKGIDFKLLRLLQLFTLIFAVLAHVIVLIGPHSPRTYIAIIPGIVTIIIAGYLLYRSLWVELPGNPHYGHTLNTSNSLCQKGTYALMRHPGLWWYGLFLIGLYLLTGSQWLLVAAPIWWILDLFLVLVEDLYLYPRIFKDYDVYKKKVPMLFPKLANLKDCLRTWNTFRRKS